MKKGKIAVVILLTASLIFTSNVFADVEGCITGNCIDGHGEVINKYVRYTGDFKNGKKQGHGTLTLSNGSQYVGSFQNGKKHGVGTFVFADCSRYPGEWKNDKMNGYGTFMFADGEKYVGDWKEGMMHGHGVLYKTDGSRYVGMWKDNFMHGKGMVIFSDGRQQAGYWNFDRFVGIRKQDTNYNSLLLPVANKVNESGKTNI